MTAPANWFVHTATVESFEDSPFGLYGAPVTVACFINDGVTDVLSASGEQIVNAARILASLADEPKFTLDSRVRYWGNRGGTVVAVARRDSGGITSLDHCEVTISRGLPS